MSVESATERYNLYCLVLVCLPNRRGETNELLDSGQSKFTSQGVVIFQIAFWRVLEAESSQTPVVSAVAISSSHALNLSPAAML